VQPADGLEQPLPARVEGRAGRLGDGALDLQLDEVGQELVQRRVEQPDGDRQAVHGPQDPEEVLPLQRQQRREGGALLLLGLGQHQVLDQLAAVAEEHVLGPAQADAAGAVPPGPLGVLRGVGVGADAEPPARVGVLDEPVHRLHEVVAVLGRQLALEVLLDRARRHGHRAEEHRAGGAVQAEDVALADHHVADRRGPRLGVDLEVLRAADAGLAHAAGHDGRVAGLAAAAGEDALRRDHPGQVVGVGLPPDQSHRPPAGGRRDRRALSKTTVPTAAPGLAPMAVSSSSASSVEPNAGNISWASCAPVTRSSASSMPIRPSSTSCVAIRNAARRCACRPGSAASRACRARS
jgi:hypothetical protein